jgi:hypothetical protein
MRPRTLAFFLFTAGILLGVLIGRLAPRETTQTIAMRWGDGKYGSAFYGAEVYSVRVGSELSVRGRVWIGPGNAYFHDCGELGRVALHEDAVARWSTIRWQEDGLYIGTGSENDYFLERKKIEAHR